MKSDQLSAHNPSHLKTKNEPQELSPINFTPETYKEDKPSEATPTNICTNLFEEDFMLDSLNDQQNLLHQGSFEIKAKEKNATDTNQTFMNVLETAIDHFEKDNEQKKAAKRSPNFSYSNATTGNSVNDKRTDPEYELLKDQYNLLLNKYSDLQLNNKQLMNDYAVLRSQYEEIKAVRFFV
jgi:hypothetical protein